MIWVLITGILDHFSVDPPPFPDAEVDFDEYFHLNSGHIFPDGRVPENYLKTAWDAIVKSEGDLRNLWIVLKIRSNPKLAMVYCMYTWGLTS